MKNKNIEEEYSQCNDCFDGDHCKGEVKRCQCKCVPNREERMKNKEITEKILNECSVEEAIRSERERVEMLIVREMNIARSEGEGTSRLTSLFNKLSAKPKWRR